MARLADCVVRDRVRGTNSSRVARTGEWRGIDKVADKVVALERLFSSLMCAIVNLDWGCLPIVGWRPG
jgi:hypothetical protein